MRGSGLRVAPHSLSQCLSFAECSLFCPALCSREERTAAAARRARHKGRGAADQCARLLSSQDVLLGEGLVSAHKISSY